MAIPKTHEGDIFNRALSRVGDSRLVLEAEKTVTGITAANPPVVSVAAHGYANGDKVLLYDLTGGAELNGRVFEIGSVAAGTFALYRETGVGYTAATAGFCRKLPATKAARTVFDAWARIRDEIIRAHPWNSVVRRTRLARLEAAKTITGASPFAGATTISVAAHGYSDGDLVLIDGIGGMTEINGRYYPVTVVSAATFTIPVDSSTYTPYALPGTARKVLPPLRPDFGYDCVYDLPEDCERVLELADDPDYGWETEGRQVVTDLGPTVPIRYARKITDPDLFDAQLTTVLVARLASEISEELTQSNTKKEALRKDFEDLISEAKRLDAQEQSGQDFAEDDWVNARL